ncbi:S-layer homology domain-containing protein [Alkalihalophilus marmarensis]|uniref:S-layer homology domain-containing protein n=1 Tax=Alkalihalophilus marmarensis TaxID=521377 RepID=UPI002DBCD2FD|nr:S-layer homology domain-containing protein [Alkalihalophilus marmarensis]MEC2071361.1 S-layer homology domain-containing protein [Alkalihalophilus marmarensis]
MSNKTKSYQKFLATSATAAAVASVGAFLPAEVSAINGFTDVESYKYYTEAVNKMTDVGFIQGIGGDRFGTNDYLKRQDAAVLFSRVLLWDVSSANHVSFKDVPEDAYYRQAVAKAVEEGVISGRSETTFSPNDHLTRGEMAVLLTRAFQLEVDHNADVPFEDVKGHPYEEDIKAVYQAGLASGVTETSFDPASEVTRAQFASFLYRSELVRTHIDVKKENQEGLVQRVEVVGDGEVTISGKSYKLSAEAGPLFSDENKEALEGSYVEFEVEADTITSVTYIALTNSNTELNGEGIEIDGSIVILADDIQLHAIRTNHLIVGEQVSSSFSANSIVVAENTTILNIVRDLGASSLDSNNPTYIFENSTLNRVNLQRSQANLKLTGQSTVETLLVEVEEAVVSLDSEVRINDLVLPEAVDAADLIENYEAVKNNIKQIGGEENPKVKPEPPTSQTPAPTPTPINPPIVSPTIINVEELLYTVAEGGEFTLPNKVPVKYSDGTPRSVAVEWESAAIDTSSIGEFEFIGSIEGYDKNIILVLRVTPEGYELSEDGKAATVSSESGFKYALQEPQIETIEVVDSITLTSNETINKKVLIPAEIADKSIDFGGSAVSELEVQGDDITVKNVVISSLVIGSEVKNIVLENVSDTEDASHIFDGGGGESVILSGDTTFNGDIRITTGSDIRITSNGEGKIEGTLWLTSDVPTKIDAPVSSLVVDTESDKIEVSAAVENMVVRQNATVIVNEGVLITNRTKRIGVEVIAKDSSGAEINIEFEEVLDTAELERTIERAKNISQNAEEGTHEGEFSPEALDALESAITAAEKILDENKEIDVETQELIDNASLDLQDALHLFRSSIVRVERVDLYLEIGRAQRLSNRVTPGDEPGQYPTDLFADLLEYIEEAQELYDTYGISQEMIDAEIAKLSEFIATFVAARIVAEDEEPGTEDPLVDGQVTFLISGDHFDNHFARVEYFGTDGAFPNGDTFLQSSTEMTNEGLVINADGIDETEFETFYITVETNGYLFIEEFTKEEVMSGEVREIEVNDNYVPIGLALPEGHQSEDAWVTLHPVLNGKPLLYAFASEGTKVPAGTYNVQFTSRGEEASYNLYKTGVTLNKDNSAVEFTDEEMAKIQFQLEQVTTNNYAIAYAFAHKSSSDFRAWSSVGFNDNVTSFYTNRFNYSNVNVVYDVEHNEEYWQIDFATGALDLKEDTIIPISDDLAVKADQHRIEDVNIHSNLYHYFNVHIENSLEQRINDISKRELTEWGFFNRTGYVNGSVTVVVNGESYSKEVGAFRFNDISISDVVGDNTFEGEAKLIFEVKDSPIPIKSFEANIIVYEGEDEGEEDVDFPTPAPQLIGGEANRTLSENTVSSGFLLNEFFIGENLTYEFNIISGEELVEVTMDDWQLSFNLNESWGSSLGDGFILEVTAENQFGTVTETVSFSVKPEVLNREVFDDTDGTKIKWLDSKLPEVSGYNIYRSISNNYMDLDLEADLIATVSPGTEEFVDKTTSDEELFYYIYPVIGERVYPSDLPVSLKSFAKQELEMKFHVFQAFATTETPENFNLDGIEESLRETEQLMEKAIEVGWSEEEIKSFLSYDNYLIAKDRIVIERAKFINNVEIEIQVFVIGADEIEFSLALGNEDQTANEGEITFTFTNFLDDELDINVSLNGDETTQDIIEVLFEELNQAAASEEATLAYDWVLEGDTIVFTIIDHSLLSGILEIKVIETENK